jgi:hypothetical protein
MVNLLEFFAVVFLCTFKIVQLFCDAVVGGEVAGKVFFIL